MTRFFGVSFWVLLSAFWSMNVWSAEADEAFVKDLRDLCSDDRAADSLFKNNSKIRKWFREYGESLCQQNPVQEEPLDDEPNRWDRLASPLTIERFELYMAQPKLEPYTGGKFAQECWIDDFHRDDSLCTSMRLKLDRLNMPMTQVQYDKLKSHCEHKHRDVAEAVRPCISEFIEEKWIIGGERQIPKIDVDGLKFEDLVSNPTVAKTNQPAAKQQTGGYNLDDLMAGEVVARQPESTTASTSGSSYDLTTGEPTVVNAEIGFDNIYEDREKITINNVKQSLFAKGEVIASRCQCSFNRQSCFNGHRFGYDQLNDVLVKADNKYESQKMEVCNSWLTNLRGRTSENENTLNQYVANSSVILSNLDKLDAGFENTNNLLANKEREIQVAIQQEQDSQGGGGFNLGKFAALATGTVIGGGMSDLGSAEMTQLLGSAAMDSMEGVEGVDNFDQGIEDITNSHMEHLDEVASIHAQTEQINSQQAQSKNYYDDIQLGSASESNLDSLHQNSSTTESKPLGKYGAGAFARDTTNDSYGFVTNKVSESEARSAALAQCGNNCKVAMVFQTCGALVTGTKPQNSNLGMHKYFWVADTQALAERIIYDCEIKAKAFPMTCAVVASGCN